MTPSEKVDVVFMRAWRPSLASECDERVHGIVRHAGKVEPLSASLFAVSSALLIAVAFGALYWPARSAARIDPAVTFYV